MPRKPPPPPPVEPRAVSVRRAALYLDTSIDTLEERIAAGDLPVYTIGGRGDRRVLVSDLDKLLVLKVAQ